MVPMKTRRSLLTTLAQQLELPFAAPVVSISTISKDMTTDSSLCSTCNTTPSGSSCNEAITLSL